MFLYEEVYQQQQYLQHGVKLNPGDTVIDVGGNIGLFAMLAAEVTRNLTCGPQVTLICCSH